ncbi:hypothetical protein pipiens_016568 [Culex pipiens pipiens]|uniref:ATPase AAA-type core domain-containing protein n=1 Tax=Culex pipiens pipiens TaxID=38569 RepID=A0ABD1CKR4_CULPP
MLDFEVMSSFIPNAKMYVSYLTTTVMSATSSCSSGIPRPSRGSFRESEEPIRKVFKHASILSPRVLFIDQINRVTSKNMERQIDAQLLSSLDGISRIKPAGCYDELAKLTPGYAEADLLTLVTRTATTDIKRMLTEIERQQ